MNVREVRVLDDGRIGAVVTVAISPQVGGTGVRDDYYIFRAVGDRLLIDYIGDATPPMGLGVGTPEPTE